VIDWINLQAIPPPITEVGLVDESAVLDNEIAVDALEAAALDLGGNTLDSGLVHALSGGCGDPPAVIELHRWE